MVEVEKGATRFKQRMLNKLGWYVISVSYKEIFEKRKKLEERMVYVNVLLRGCHEQLIQFEKLVKTSYFVKFNRWKKLTKPF